MSIKIIVDTCVFKTIDNTVLRNVLQASNYQIYVTSPIYKQLLRHKIQLFSFVKILPSEASADQSLCIYAKEGYKVLTFDKNVKKQAGAFSVIKFSKRYLMQTGLLSPGFEPGLQA